MFYFISTEVAKRQDLPCLRRYEQLCCRWYPLQCKPGQNKTDYRGELEVKIGFTVRASNNMGGSTADLARKNKGSISSLNKVASDYDTEQE